MASGNNLLNEGLRPRKEMEKSTIVQVQPSDNFQPWQFLSNVDNEDKFDELLEQYQSTAGFEIVADTNQFLIKHRFQEKDAYTKVSKYDIIDEDAQQYLFVSTKDYSYRCFHLLISTTVSVFTDCYKDPIFITTSYFSKQRKHCCTITTSSGATVGVIDHHGSSNDFVITNEHEESTLNVICTNEDGGGQTNFDIWDGSNCVAATITRRDTNEITVCTTGSLSSVNKILILGFTFYLDGIYRGDNNGLNLYSFIGL